MTPSTPARWLDWGYIAATIVFTVAGQLLLKWRMDRVGSLPDGAWNGLRFLLALLVDPLVVASFVAAFVAALAWMAAMTRFELTTAYPFLALNFVVVLLVGAWLLGEPPTWPKVAGVALIVAGVVLVGGGVRSR